MSLANLFSQPVPPSSRAPPKVVLKQIERQVALSGASKAVRNANRRRERLAAEAAANGGSSTSTNGGRGAGKSGATAHVGGKQRHDKAHTQQGFESKRSRHTDDEANDDDDDDDVDETAFDFLGNFSSAGSKNNNNNDDDDDDDDNDDEDNANANDDEDRTKRRDEAAPRPRLSAAEQQARDLRTLFVGNVSTKAKAAMPRKFAAHKKALHPERQSMNAYVVMATTAEARASLVLNGSVLLERTLRVDIAGAPSVANDRTVFVGNLPFVADEEELRQFFKDCGEIDNVRIVRDAKVNLGKGIAFVAFREHASVARALAKKDTPFSGRTLRIDRIRRGRAASARRERDSVARGKGAAPFEHLLNKRKSRFDEARGTAKRPKTDAGNGGARDGDAADGDKFKLRNNVKRHFKPKGQRKMY